ncbi:MAG TPA: PIN domain-containing protein [Bryobacteraceae bacterium]|nr:PIN domain-containing protein [Bryobacteraceae bacterium]
MVCEDGSDGFGISPTIGEILVKPNRDNDSDVRNSRPEIHVLIFDASAAQHYGRLREDRSIRVPDAIQLARAASAAIDLFTANDDRLSRKNPGINFITGLARAPI